jgi:branched-chain amino acid transport system substrate-binding protein
VKLIGSSTMANETFASQLGAAAAETYLATPLLAARMYPSSAQHVFSAYRRTFGQQATPEALYGYEAMNLVLDAIRAAHSHGDDRQQIIERVLHTHDRDSAIGHYSIEADGETTLTRYAADVVAGGRPVFFRAFSVSPSEIPSEIPSENPSENPSG